MAARLTSRILQQYKIGFKVELRNTRVPEISQAYQRDGVSPLMSLMLIKAKTALTGR